MARLETWYKQDLKRPLFVHKHTDVFNQDSKGNLIGVEVYSDGEPVVLSGSISGYCLLANGTTVPAVGASRSGNKASVLIPQTAYSVPGPITITIKNVEGDNITTLCATVGIVRQSVSGNLVNPGSVVTDWSNDINAQLQAVQTAADNVGAIVAAPFDENMVYVVGNYVTNNGNLYRITANHAAGVAWANTAKEQCTVGNELEALNNHFIANRNLIDPEAASNEETDFIPVELNVRYNIIHAQSKGQFQYDLSLYDSNKAILYIGQLVDEATDGTNYFYSCQFSESSIAYVKIEIDSAPSGIDTTDFSKVFFGKGSEYIEFDDYNVIDVIKKVKDNTSDITNLKSALGGVNDKINPVFIPVDISALDWQEGFVRWNSEQPTAASANGSCKVSSPIFVRKGQTIIVNCSGYANETSIISEVLRIGSTPQLSFYQPLVKDIGTVNHQYVYTATSDMYIAVTYYYGASVPVTISIVYQIDAKFEEVKTIALDKSFLTSMSVYTTTGFNTYNSWFSSDYISLDNIKELVYLRSNSFTTIYMIAFFDESKTFISGKLPAISKNDVETIFTDITIPSNAKYFRVASCIGTGFPIGILGYIEKTTTLLSKKIDLTNRILSKNLWLGTAAISQYNGWYSTDYIDLDNVKKIMKVSTIGHTLLNGLTLFDADKNPTRGFTATGNNIHYILEDIELLPNEKYAVVSWGEIVIDGVLAKSSDIDFLVELIEPEPTAEDYSYLVSQFDNILCIGDSLTRGDYGSIPEGTANTHEKNYPHYLSRYLNTNVINQGVNGTYPRWWWNNKSRIDLTIDYDCIFFFLGTNFGLTDTITEDTASGDYNTYADTETGRYCSMIEWLKENIPNAKIFLISFPHNYRDWIWYINILPVLYKISEKYNLPVVDMTVDVPFTRYNGDIYRPVGYNPNGDTLPEKYGNLHFGTLGYQTFAEYLIRNTGKVMSENLIEYKGKLD